MKENSHPFIFSSAADSGRVTIRASVRCPCAHVLCTGDITLRRQHPQFWTECVKDKDMSWSLVWGTFLPLCSPECPVSLCDGCLSSEALLWLPSSSHQHASLLKCTTQAVMRTNAQRLSELGHRKLLVFRASRTGHIGALWLPLLLSHRRSDPNTERNIFLWSCRFSKL